MEQKKDIRRQKGEQTRGRLLEATLSVLMRQGIQGFTAQNVAREAQVSKATLFHHFDTLDELLLGAIFHVIDMIMHDHREEEHSDVGEYIRCMGQRVLGMLARQPEVLKASYVMLERAAFNEAVRLKGREMQRHVLENIEADLEKLVPAENRRWSIKHMALALGTLLDGMGNDWIFNKDLKRLEDFWNEVADFFAAGLKGETQ